MFLETQLFISAHISFVMFLPGNVDADFGWGGHLNDHMVASRVRNTRTKNYYNQIFFKLQSVNVGDVFETQCTYLRT